MIYGFSLSAFRLPIAPNTTSRRHCHDHRYHRAVNPAYIGSNGKWVASALPTPPNPSMSVSLTANLSKSLDCTATISTKRGDRTIKPVVAVHNYLDVSPLTDSTFVYASSGGRPGSLGATASRPPSSSSRPASAAMLRGEAKRTGGVPAPFGGSGPNTTYFPDKPWARISANDLDRAPITAIGRPSNASGAQAKLIGSK